jgi:hypothetical protein
MIVVAVHSATDRVSAQALGTFRWQLQPFCNVVTLTIARENGVYTLDGVDDGCGAGPPATVLGTAFPNPDGSIGLGWSSSIPPLVSPLALEARLDIATLGGTWSDSAGNSGALRFAPGGGLGGPMRPVSLNGLRPASVVAGQMAPGAVGADQLAPGAVTAAALAPGAIAGAAGIFTSERIAEGAITATHVAPGAVDLPHLAARAVGSDQIAGSAITAAHFTPGAVNAALGTITSAQIAPGSIQPAHLATPSVTSADLAPGSIGPAAIAAGAIGSSQLAPGAIGASQLAAGAVQAAHLAPDVLPSLIVGTCPPGQYLRGLEPNGAVRCEPFFVPTRTNVITPTSEAWLWPTMAVGEDSRPVVAAYDSNQGRLKVLKCHDASCAAGYSTALPDEPLTFTGFYPSIAIGVDGHPIIAHADLNADTLRVTWCGDPACSSGNISTLAGEPGNGTGTRQSIAIGADGLAVIAHLGLSGLRVTKCGNTACTAGNLTTAVGGPDDGREPSIASGPDGRPVISHGAATAGGLVLKMTRCGNPACSSGNTTVTVHDATPLNLGVSSSIAFGAGGLPVISYRESTSARLWVTRCGDASCSAGNTTTLLSGLPRLWDFVSMAIAHDGLPIIVLSDRDRGVLYAVTCGDDACATGNVITAIDESGSRVGNWVSIRIGSDGLPAIAHGEFPGGLRLTKCATSSCR